MEWLVEVRQQNTAMQHTASAARDVGRDANRVVANLLKNLKGWGVRLTAIGSRSDVQDKIDGHFTDGPLQGRSLQIIRRVSASARDDFAIQIVSKQADLNLLLGRDIGELISSHYAKLSSPAEVYVMLNADDNALFLADIADIRRYVDRAVEGMRGGPMQGRFSAQSQSYFDNYTGITMRVAKSYEGHSVLAYVPAHRISFETVPVTPRDLLIAERGEQTIRVLASALPQGVSQAWFDAVVEAEKGLPVTLKLPNNLKKLKDLQAFAAKRGVRLDVLKDRMVLTKK